MIPFHRQTSAAPVAVVGAGNWLISCDRIGSTVLQGCRKRFDPDVDLIEIGSTGLALLDHIAGQELMIVVDACCNIGPQGNITVLEPEFNSPATITGGSHQIGPLETLTVANFLYPEKMPDKILLILVETNGMDDVAMEAACAEIIRVIEEKIESWQHRKN